jgi:hypothetical protein
MFYSSDADATRAFLRDKLRFPFTDVGGGWLIFDLPEADMGCHPTPTCGNEGNPVPPAGTQSISFHCDRIEPTVSELKSRGVEFTRPITDAGYGLVTAFKMPGGIEVELYQPHYSKNPHA